MGKSDSGLWKEMGLFGGTNRYRVVHKSISGLKVAHEAGNSPGNEKMTADIRRKLIRSDQLRWRRCEGRSGRRNPFEPPPAKLIGKFAQIA